MRYRYCPNCNRQVSEYSRQCEYCGAALSSHNEDTSYILEENNGYGAKGGSSYGPYNNNDTETGYYDNSPRRNPYSPYGPGNRGSGDRNSYEQRRMQRKKDDSNFWTIFTVGVLLFIGIASLALVLIKNNGSLKARNAEQAQHMKSLSIDNKRKQLDAQKAEEKLKEKEKAEKTVAASVANAQPEVSDFMSTSSGSANWPFKSVSSIRSKLKSRGFKLIDEIVDHYDWGTFTTYTYHYDGKGSNYCTVVFDSAGDTLKISFGSSSQASSFENKLVRFFNKTVNIDGYTYTVEAGGDLNYYRTGNTIIIERVGC